jgi:hypothetical protein
VAQIYEQLISPRIKRKKSLPLLRQVQGEDEILIKKEYQEWLAE